LTDNNLGCPCDGDKTKKTGFGCTGLCTDELNREGIEQNEFLDCIPWDGEEKSLPNGGQIRDPSITIEDMFSNWNDVEFGIQLEVDEKLYDEIVKTYGDRSVLIAESTDGSLLTRKEWAAKYGTDGLKLWGIKSKFYATTGGGVVKRKIGPGPAGTPARP